MTMRIETMRRMTMTRRTRIAVLKKAECATLQDYNGSNNDKKID